MGYIKIQLSDQAEKKFRQAAMKRFGYTKGALSQAAEKALLEWSDKELTSEEVSRIIHDAEISDIVSEIKGILKHVKGKTSVELQREASKIRAKSVWEGLKSYKKRNISAKNLAKELQRLEMSQD